MAKTREIVNIDWSKKCGYRVPVRRQGNTLSCTAFATTGLVDYWKDCENLGEFSVQHLLDLAPIEPENEETLKFDLSKLLDYVKNEGICLKSEHRELDWKRQPTDCKGKRHKLEFEKIPDDENVMMDTLMKRGPFIARIYATDEFWNWRGEHTRSQVFVQKGKKVNFEKGKETEKHAVLVVGYGSKKVNRKEWVNYFIIQNSWGIGWADGGYAKVCMGSNTKDGFCTLKPLYIPSSMNMCGELYIPKSVSIQESSEPDLGSMGHAYTREDQLRKYEEVCPPKVEDFCSITDTDKVPFSTRTFEKGPSATNQHRGSPGDTSCCLVLPIYLVCDSWDRGGIPRINTLFRKDQHTLAYESTEANPYGSLSPGGIHTWSSFLEMGRGDRKLRVMDPQFCAAIACDIYEKLRMAEVPFSTRTFEKGPSATNQHRGSPGDTSCCLVLPIYLVCDSWDRGGIPRINTLFRKDQQTLAYESTEANPYGCLSPGGIHTWSSFLEMGSGDRKLMVMDPQFFAAIACDIYEKLRTAEVLQMESAVLDYLKSEMTSPTAYYFLR